MTENYLFCAQIIPDAGEQVRVRADGESFRPLLCPPGTHPTSRSAWGSSLTFCGTGHPFLTRLCSLLTQVPATHCSELGFSRVHFPSTSVPRHRDHVNLAPLLPSNVPPLFQSPPVGDPRLRTKPLLLPRASKSLRSFPLSTSAISSLPRPRHLDQFVSRNPIATHFLPCKKLS